MRLKASPRLWRSSLFLRDINHHKRFHFLNSSHFVAENRTKFLRHPSFFLSKMYSQTGSLHSSKEKQLSILANWPVTLTLGSDLLIRGFRAPNPTRNSRDTSGYFTCLSMRGVTLPGLLGQSIVRTTGWGMKQQRVREKNEVSMNNPGKAEGSSFTIHPLTNSKHAHPKLEREGESS